MTDLDRLQGAWTVVSMEMEGNSMTPPGGARIVIEGERFQSLGMGAVYAGKVRVNARTRPRQFDLEFNEGPERGNTSLGIYELDGDAWKICLTVTGKLRPREFKAPPGSGLAVEQLLRGTVPLAPADTAPLGDPAPEIEGEWKMTACIANGVTVPESMVRTGRRVAHDGQTTSWFGKQVILEARYGLDRSVSPWNIDYLLKDGRRQQGICRLAADGALEIAFSSPGSPRPSDFKTAGVTFTAWRRV